MDFIYWIEALTATNTDFAYTIETCDRKRNIDNKCMLEYSEILE